MDQNASSVFQNVSSTFSSSLDGRDSVQGGHVSLEVVGRNSSEHKPQTDLERIDLDFNEESARANNEQTCAERGQTTIDPPTQRTYTVPATPIGFDMVEAQWSDRVLEQSETVRTQERNSTRNLSEEDIARSRRTNVHFGWERRGLEISDILPRSSTFPVSSPSGLQAVQARGSSRIERALGKTWRPIL